VALVRIGVSEEIIASINRVKGISELATLLVVTSTADDGGDMFFRNVDSYKSHTASHLSRTTFLLVTAVKT
jgi:hypothetical protein